MQGKGLIKFFTVLLLLVALYQLLISIPVRNIDNRAAELGQIAASGIDDPVEAEAIADQVSEAYIDSISDETISVFGLNSFKYNTLKKQQLALGLDLKGGMSVVMQIDLKDFLITLSKDNQNANFRKALDLARKKQVEGSNTDFITLFGDAWGEVANGQKLSRIFRNNTAISDDVDQSTSDAEVLTLLRQEANETVQLTYSQLNKRFDKSSFAQPNVTLDERTDRILVELPGVKNQKRARNFLKSTALLEFWHVKQGQEMNPLFQQANELLRSKLDVKIDTIYETRIDTIGYNSDSTVITEEINDTIVDMASLNPLLEFFNPDGFRRDGEQVLGESGYLGYAKEADRDTVLTMLNMKGIKQLFPNVKWAWSSNFFKGDTGEKFYTLHGLDTRGKKKALMDGEVITSAKQDIDPTTNESVVSLTMNNTGARKWAQITKEAFADNNREVAITLDNEVVSAPAVQGEITGGRTQITGSFSAAEAKDLADILNAGKLPAKLEIIEENVVGPTLGAENIRRSIISLIVGLFLVLIFMILYYGKSGVVAIVSLFLNVLFIVAILASFGTVLTLPGIAGLVLTIGMAVDANVIIFERIREELRNGKSITAAINDGFKQSYSAIIDANITTLIVAGILYTLGSGPIKGFASVLGIGVVLSVFTAVFFGRMVIEWWNGKNESMSFWTPISKNAFSNVNIDWLKKRKVAYIFSGVIIVAGLISMFTRGFDLGVDFKGGYKYAIEFEEGVNTSSSEISTILTESFGVKPVVKTFGGNNTYEVTTTYLINEKADDTDAKVLSKLHEGISKISGVTSNLTEFSNVAVANTKTHYTQSSKVGPTIANDIKKSAFKASIFALVLIFLYILFRFSKWQYSLGAVAALFHDVLFVLAIFTLFKGLSPFSLELDQNFIAAILTVIGYSINDTVVVFDRIREFMNSFTKKSRYELVNRAVNNTISRTIITSLTTLFVIAILFIFGGASIRGFAFALLIGVLIGTYSSVFIATPVMYDLTKERELKDDSAKNVKREKA